MERDPSRAGESPDEAAVTRRSVLAKSAAALGTGAVAAGGLVGASGVTSAQVTEAAAIPEPTEWNEGTNFAGFMIHIGSTASIDRADAAQECPVPGSDTWPPDELLAYEVQLINRKDDAATEEGTTMYIGGRAEVAPGKLYIINRFNRCGNGFIGATIEQIGRSDVDVNVGGQNATTTTGDGGSGAFGPGFGPLATAAALLGGGALLRRRDDDED